MGAGVFWASASSPCGRRGAGWLRSGRPTVVAGAPGRLDVMGGIADYSGAVVLEGTIGDLALVALQRRSDGRLRVRTAGAEASRLTRREVELPAGAFLAPDGTLLPYEAVRAAFPAEGRWAAYVLGVLYVLLAEGELPLAPPGAPGGVLGGADVLLVSSVPLGAGVASSAAVEVATMRAAGAAFGARLDGLRLAALCQMVENRVVGAPCGIMDQVTCTLGEAGRLLALRCQPHDVLGWHAPPPGATFVGLDSGVKHAVGGRRYGRARCAAFMGREIIREHLRRERTAGGPARLDGPARLNYLCDLTPAAYRARWRALLPQRLSGRAFLDRWGETGDPATRVDPDETYPVRGATEHPIYENDRVQRFIGFLEAGTPGALRGAGRLMYGAHRSYSRNCGLGSRETDLLVSLVRRSPPEGRPLRGQDHRGRVRGHGGRAAAGGTGRGPCPARGGGPGGAERGATPAPRAASPA